MVALVNFKQYLLLIYNQYNFENTMNPLIQNNVDTNIDENKSFVVCCYFTASYKEHAMRLKESLVLFGLNYHLSQVEDAGYWEANTRIKPYFILEYLKLYPNMNIVYLDADALVKAPLDYFDTIETDISVYVAKGKKGMSHDYLTGTLFFKNTEATLKFINQWIEEQSAGKRTQVDQDSFDAAMIKCQSNLSVTPLPSGYIKIFDRENDGQVFIEQYQASRGQTKLRRQKIRRRNRIAGVVLIATIGIALYSVIN